MFTIHNQEAQTGTWYYDYTFTGDKVVTKSGFKQILPNHESTAELSYECGVDEEVTGQYTITEAPKKGEVCKDVTVDKEVETCRDVEKTRTVTKERSVTKTASQTQYKTLFEMWFGG